MAVGRIIQGPDCIAEGVAALSQADPRFAAAVDAMADPIPLRLRPGGFETLLQAIVGQQVSVAAAASIWAKVQGAGLACPDTVLQADDAAFRAAGLSRQKMKYTRALAAAAIDYDALATMPNDAVIKTLTQVSGIGTWTAEIYAMFSLGRADVFAHGDLALQEGARMLLDLPDRPKEKAMRDIATAWSPWRSVAARVLWAYYAHVKQREGVQ